MKNVLSLIYILVSLLIIFTGVKIIWFLFSTSPKDILFSQLIGVVIYYFTTYIFLKFPFPDKV